MESWLETVDGKAIDWVVVDRMGGATGAETPILGELSVVGMRRVLTVPLNSFMESWQAAVNL